VGSAAVVAWGALDPRNGQGLLRCLCYCRPHVEEFLKEKRLMTQWVVDWQTVTQ